MTAITFNIQNITATFELTVDSALKLQKTIKTFNTMNLTVLNGNRDVALWCTPSLYLNVFYSIHQPSSLGQAYA